MFGSASAGGFPDMLVKTQRNLYTEIHMWVFTDMSGEAHADAFPDILVGTQRCFMYGDTEDKIPTVAAWFRRWESSLSRGQGWCGPYLMYQQCTISSRSID